VGVAEVTKGGAAVSARRRRPRVERGFTLLELIVTLLILMVIVGISVPVVGRSSDAVRSRAQVAGFSAVLRHAREQAISTRLPHRVVVDPSEHVIRVYTGEEVRRTRTIPSRWTFDTRDAATLAVRFEPHGSSTGGEYRIAADDIAWRVTIDAFTGRVRTVRDER
jgi:type II secretory pathway pseudopilin PulG